MSQTNQEHPLTNIRRQTMTFPVFPIDEGHGLVRRLSASTNVHNRLSTVAQICLPYGNEYRSQERVPPASADFPRQRRLTRVEGSDEHINEHRLSIISEDYDPIEDDEGRRATMTNDILIRTVSNRRRHRMLFIVEPIIVGFILLPIITLFWECGWNLVWILLNTFNGYPLTIHSNKIIGEDLHNYSWYSLLIPYLIVQILLLISYLCQDVLYNFLRRQNHIVTIVLLKYHIFLLASIYIVQWEILSIIWDQYTPHEWHFELVLSLAALFALIVFIGHLSDLVCAPFLVSYDSIEYCLHFGCPLLTRQMQQWKIHLINYMVYEIIISNLTIVVWRGFYNVLDVYLYPDDSDKSALICLFIGYVLYFPLMYFQSYLEYLNLKFDFWIFVSINFPQLYRNIRHLFAFLSCLFLWRGFWLLYGSYLVIFKFHYQTYSLVYLVSFLVLAFMQTSSSTNGPLSNMEDDNHFFPLYPHCYVSILARKFS